MEEIQTHIKIQNADINKTRELLKEKNKFQKSNNIYFFNGEKHIYQIKLDILECDCKKFKKIGTCHHLIAVAIMENIDLRGLKLNNTLHSHKRKRVIIEDDEDDPNVAEFNSLADNLERNLVEKTQNNDNLVSDQQEAVTLGRPRLASKALDINNLRRSKRLKKN